jgi:hypothetical protein
VFSERMLAELDLPYEIVPDPPGVIVHVDDDSAVVIVLDEISGSDGSAWPVVCLGIPLIKRLGSSTLSTRRLCELNGELLLGKLAIVDGELWLQYESFGWKDPGELRLTLEWLALRARELRERLQAITQRELLPPPSLERGLTARGQPSALLVGEPATAAPDAVAPVAATPVASERSAPAQAPAPPAGRPWLLVGRVLLAVSLVAAIVLIVTRHSTTHTHGHRAALPTVVNVPLRRPFVIAGARFAVFTHPTLSWTRSVPPLPASSGRRLLLLQVNVRNLSRSDFDPYRLGYRVVDGRGQAFSPDPRYGSGPKLHSPAVMAPRDTHASTMLAFVIPATATQLELVFSDGTGRQVHAALGQA